MLPFLALSLTAFVLVDASPAVGHQAQTVRRRDSAGVAIVENGAALASLPVWRVDPTPQVSIGGGEGPSSFTGIIGARRLADGSILVVDTRASEVKLFDPAGKFLKVIGARGAGPGEFRSPWIPTPLGGDSLYIIDFGLRRATLLRGASHLADVSVPSPSRTLPMQVIAMVSSDTFVANALTSSMSQQVGIRVRNPMPFLRVTASAVVDTLAVGKGTEGRTATFTEGAYTGVTIRAVYWGGQTKVTFHGRRLLLGDTDSPEISVIDTRSRNRQLIRWRSVADALTAADRRAAFIFDSTTLASNPGGDAGMRASMFEGYRNRDHADRAPAFTDLLATDEGGVWVEQFHRPWTLVRRYLVFDQTGALQARVELPPNVRPYQVADDRLIARWRDEDDVDHVRVYRILRSAR